MRDPTPESDEAPGLPAFRSWRGVYWFVLGCFALYVLLLSWLTRHYA